MQAILAAAAQGYLKSQEVKNHHALKSTMPEVEVPTFNSNFDTKSFLKEADEEHDHENLPGSKMLNWIDHELMVQRSIYTGFYSGLYTSSRKNQVPKPTPECMGNWIVEDMKEIDHFWV